MNKALFYLNEQERDELVGLVQRLIQFPTEDPPGHEIEMAHFLHETLQSWGFASTLDEFEPGRANVVARVKGNGSRPGLVFSAHIDTMTIGTGAWRYPPFGGEIHEGKLFGRGASDMKGGMAAMMIAARRVAQWAFRKGDLILALSAGESSNCLGAKRMLETNALDGAGAIIVSEPSSLRILVAETGTWWVKASATGIPGHASGATGGLGVGSNAILKLVDFINDLRHFSFPVERDGSNVADAHPLLGKPTIRIGTIAGGTAVNQTPDYAELGLDIRFLPGMEVDVMLAALQRLAGPNITFETIDWKPPVEIPSDHPLVQLSMEACRWRLGEVPSPGGVAYYSDAVIFSPALGLPRVILGPGELGMSGQRDEYVELDKLVAASEIYQHIAYDLLIM